MTKTVKTKRGGNHTIANINAKIMREALEAIANVPYIKVVQGSSRELFHNQVAIATQALEQLRVKEQD